MTRAPIAEPAKTIAPAETIVPSPIVVVGSPARTLRDVPEDELLPDPPTSL